MAKIDVAQFLGKPKIYSISGKDVPVEPLHGKDIDLLFGIRDGKEAEGAKKLIAATFDLTEEEYNKLSMDFINEAVVAILDVNGLKKKE